MKQDKKPSDLLRLLELTLIYLDRMKQDHEDQLRTLAEIVGTLDGLTRADIEAAQSTLNSL